MGNNIFWNFSWGNNIPKIFSLFICMCFFGGKVCIYVCHYFYFIVLVSWIPKSLNYLRGACVWLGLVIVISSHTHILGLFFCFLFFYMVVESLTRLVSVFLGFVIFFMPLFHLFVSFLFRISSKFVLNLHPLFMLLNSWTSTFIVTNHIFSHFHQFFVWISLLLIQNTKMATSLLKSFIKVVNPAVAKAGKKVHKILKVTRLRGKHVTSSRPSCPTSRTIFKVSSWGSVILDWLTWWWCGPRNRAGARGRKWKCSGGFWGGNSLLWSLQTK